MRQLTLFLLAFSLSLLTGCETEIKYIGTDCQLDDSLSTVYNTELQAAYQKIDSGTLEMLKGRGPKGTRVENEDIDDEYKGARDFSDEAKENIRVVLFHKHCVTVDRYQISDPDLFQSTYITLSEFQIQPQDTARFHKAKREFMSK